VLVFTVSSFGKVGSTNGCFIYFIYLGAWPA